MFILKSGTSGNTAEVDKNNRVQAFSTSQTHATAAALMSDYFNVNSGTINLTSASSSGLLYVKNLDTVQWSIGRVFYNFGNSTGGTGDALAEILSMPSAGTLVSGGSVVTPANFNFASPKLLLGTVLAGVEGSTVTDGTVAISSIIPAVATRVLITFDSIVLDPGASLAIRITPQTSNTSMNIQVGLNLHREA